jgi:PAS domain S-box-containing protein
MSGANRETELEVKLARAEQRLDEMLERYALATAAANVGVWDWNLETGDFYLDPNVKGFLGYGDDEIPNDIEIWAGFVHPDDKEPVMKAAQDVIDGRSPRYVFEHRMCHKDGSVRWIMVRGEVVRNEMGRAIRFVGTDTDVTERRQLEQSARALSSEIQMRIGHDLHGGVGHDLSGLALLLEQIELQLTNEGSQYVARVHKALELARSVIQTTRNLAQSLSPVVRTAGLAKSLRQFAIDAQQWYGIKCSVQLPERALQRFSDIAANELYCIVREAVLNAVKNGQATGVEIEARVVGQRLLLNIADNGMGYGGVLPDDPSMGLKIMQYRARDLGGSITITRRRGAGTLVVCSCPVPTSPKEQEKT